MDIEGTEMLLNGRKLLVGVDYALNPDTGAVTMLRPVANVSWKKRRFNTKKSLQNYRRRNKEQRFTLVYTYLN